MFVLIYPTCKKRGRLPRRARAPHSTGGTRNQQDLYPRCSKPAHDILPEYCKGNKTERTDTRKSIETIAAKGENTTKKGGFHMSVIAATINERRRVAAILQEIGDDLNAIPLSSALNVPPAAPIARHASYNSWYHVRSLPRNLAT